jgi:hypothetical protein
MEKEPEKKQQGFSFGGWNIKKRKLEIKVQPTEEEEQLDENKGQKARKSIASKEEREGRYLVVFFCWHIENYPIQPKNASDHLLTK